MNDPLYGLSIVSVRIRDDNGYIWIWDPVEQWLDIEYGVAEVREEGSGYPARTFEEVKQILIDGGFIDG